MHMCLITKDLADNQINEFDRVTLVIEGCD